MYDAYPFDPRSGVWTTPALPPPARRLGDRQTCVFPLSRRLAGEWSFLPSPLAGVPSPFAADQDFDFSDALPWQDVLAPACLAMQGFDLENNREYYYRTRVDLPAGCAGKRLLIRFEGVYSNARVWVNGRFLRSHAGGFTPFDCDISDFGDLPFVTLVVGVADLEGDTPGIWNPHGRMQGDPSWASYYAHFNIGGILRPVSLLVLEPCHIAAVIPETVLEKGACRFRLGVTVAVPESGAPKDLVLEQELTDPHGRVVLQNRLAVEERFRLPLRREPARTMDPAPDWCARRPESHAADLRRAGGDPGASVPDKDLYGLGLSQIVPDALLWTAESPFLYTLRLRLTAGGRLLEEVEQAVGLREILYGGAKATAPNRLYVNGKEVKLRGACRHDVSARFGRSMTPEEERREVQAYKRCNLNFVRTSHYPPSEHFLSLCDRYGLYVEVENAACFKGANGVEIHCPPSSLWTQWPRPWPRTGRTPAF